MGVERTENEEQQTVRGCPEPVRVEGTDIAIASITAGEIAVGDAVAGGAIGCVVRPVLAVERNDHLVDLELEWHKGKRTLRVKMPESEPRVLRFSTVES